MIQIELKLYLTNTDNNTKTPQLNNCTSMTIKLDNY